MPERSIRILSAADVRRALPMSAAVRAMREAFIQLSSGAADLPLRTRIDIPTQRGVTLVMPSHLPSQRGIGVKIVTLFEGNRDAGLPFVQAVMVVFDGADGRPLALMDGETLTAIRTGAACGVATDLLARQGAESVAVFGAGVQGRTQLEAVHLVRKVTRACVYDVDRQTAARFADEMSATLAIAVGVASSPGEAASQADIICTATTSTAPVFSDRDLGAGVHINAVGSYKPQVREIPGETVARARVVVDHRPAALSEAGDILMTIREGLISEDHIQAEIGEIASGRRPGRQSDDEITLFKSVGVAVQDLAAAMRVLDAANRLNLGTQAPI
jgi:ornithine cyclodeaminase/alanine dehydrogenase-like protein (mu-crystallin family)